MLGALELFAEQTEMVASPVPPLPFQQHVGSKCTLPASVRLSASLPASLHGGVAERVGFRSALTFLCFSPKEVEELWPASVFLCTRIPWSQFMTCQRSCNWPKSNLFPLRSIGSLSMKVGADGGVVLSQLLLLSPLSLLRSTYWGFRSPAAPSVGRVSQAAATPAWVCSSLLPQGCPSCVSATTFYQRQDLGVQQPRSFLFLNRTI